MKTKLLIPFLLAAMLLILVACKAQVVKTETNPPGDKETEIVNGFLIPDSVDGYNWPSGAEVTIRVYSAPGGGLLTSTKGVVESGGHFVLPVDMTMTPGMTVEATDGKTTQTTTLVSLTIDDIDVDGDTVSGTALGGGKLHINLGNLDDNTSAVVWATADGGGHWKASFAGVFDITPTTVVQATEVDANGNGTIVKINQSELNR
jgi:hypothetical protein